MLVKMFDESIIARYTTRDCIELAYCLTQRLIGAEIYFLCRIGLNEVEKEIHAMVKYKGCYYDILGCHSSEEEYIEAWKEKGIHRKRSTYKIRPLNPKEIKIPYRKGQFKDIEAFVDTYMVVVGL